MPDNWGFVAAAYSLAALVLAGYWRYLRRRERELSAEGASTTPSDTSPKNSEGSGGNAAARTGKAAAR